MLLIFANLSAHYLGRSDSILSQHDRLVILKPDGSVAVHSDKGYKPVNYMATVSEHREIIDNGEVKWIFINSKEELTITFHRIYSKFDLNAIGEDAGHTHQTGREKDVQDWIINNLEHIDPSLTFIDREFQTGAGPVDLLLARGAVTIAAEVKKTAPMNTVGQVLRYMDALRETSESTMISGMIIATEFKPKTLELADKKEIECVLITPEL